MKLYMHQTTWDYLKKHPDVVQTPGQKFVGAGGVDSIFGTDIVIDNYMKPTTKIMRWEFPKEPFITYEESDEPWCRYFGIGKEVWTGNWDIGDIWSIDENQIHNTETRINTTKPIRRSMIFDPFNPMVKR